MWPASPKGENSEMTDYLWPFSLSLKALDFTTFIIKLIITKGIRTSIL
jgi:hypothetical protein